MGPNFRSLMSAVNTEGLLVMGFIGDVTTSKKNYFVNDERRLATNLVCSRTQS